MATCWFVPMPMPVTFSSVKSPAVVTPLPRTSSVSTPPCPSKLTMPLMPVTAFVSLPALSVSAPSPP